MLVHNDIRKVPGFTGRKDLLDAIEAALWGTAGGAAALTDTSEASAAATARSGPQATAVRGMGGVGKSVLARQYAWENQARYRGVWWVRAEDPQTLIDDLIALGSRLLVNLTEIAEREQALHRALDEIARSATKEWPWLIVYDNVEKPEDIETLTPKSGAQILITSRCPRWTDHAKELPVDVFPPETAIDFLLAGRPRETCEAASRLAIKLGYLPLALNHARAYCADANLSFDAYAARFAKLISAPTNPVFVTFDLAITKAAQTCPEAEKLMAIAAFLAPERIPLDIITEDVMSEAQRDEAVLALRRLSLVEHDGTETEGTRAITVHRLVQEVMRGRLGEHRREIQQIALRLMRNALDAVAVREHVNWPHVATLLPHAIAALEPLDNRTEVEAGQLCNLLGLYFRSRGDAAAGTPYAVRALAIAETALGKEHPDTGTSLNNLAGLYRSQGRYEAAEPLYHPRPGDCRDRARQGASDHRNGEREL